MDTIEVDGVHFIKSARAAKETGYTADYVGQLCRGGKVESRLVGRTWYVRDGALEEHRKEKSRQNQTKTSEDVAKLLEEDQKARQMPRGAYLSPYKERLLDTNITYSPDNTTRFIHTTPPLEEQQVEDVPVVYEQPLAEVLEEEVFTPTEEPEEDLSYVPIRVEEEIEIAQPSEMLMRDTVMETQPPAPAVEDAYISYVPEDAYTEDRSTVKASQFVPALVSVTAMILLVASIFLQNVWVYQSDENRVGKPQIQTSFGIASVSAILEAVQE